MSVNAQYFKDNYPEYTKCMQRRSYLRKQIKVFQNRLEVCDDEAKKLVIICKIDHYNDQLELSEKELKIYREKYGIKSYSKNVAE